MRSNEKLNYDYFYCPPFSENSLFHTVSENLFNSSEKPESDDTDAPTVLPERPRMTTEPVAAPEETTQVHVKIERGTEGEVSHGSKMESVSASLVMLVWLLAALVLWRFEVDENLMRGTKHSF